MFDISFTEVLVIAAVALIVLGPERLPKVARTLGHLFGRAQRYVNDVKNDIQREMELDELKKWKASVEGTGHSIEDTVRTELDKFREALEPDPEAPAAEPSAPPSGTGTEPARPRDTLATATHPVTPPQTTENPPEAEANRDSRATE